MPPAEGLESIADNWESWFLGAASSEIFSMYGNSKSMAHCTWERRTEREGESERETDRKIKIKTRRARTKRRRIVKPTERQRIHGPHKDKEAHMTPYTIQPNRSTSTTFWVSRYVREHLLFVAHPTAVCDTDTCTALVEVKCMACIS